MLSTVCKQKKGNLWLKPSSVKHIYQNSTFEKSLLVTTKLLISGKMGAGYLLRCWMIEPSELTLQTFLTSTERQDTKISPADDAILKQTHIIFWLNQGIQWPLWMKVMESWKSPLSINIKLITVLICSDEQWQKNALHHSESAHPHCNYQLIQTYITQKCSHDIFMTTKTSAFTSTTDVMATQYK